MLTSYRYLVFGLFLLCLGSISFAIAQDEETLEVTAQDLEAELAAASSASAQTTEEEQPVSEVTEEQSAPATGKAVPGLPESFASSFTTIDQEVFEGRVVFSLEAFGARRIVQLDIATKRITPLVYDSGDNTYPSWSPDGHTLAFASDRFGNFDIFTIDWDGTNLKRITSDSADEGDPSWHPNGKSIIFYRDGESKRTANLFEVDIDSKHVTQITDFQDGRSSTPKFSPDAQLIAYSTNRFWPGWDVCIWNVSVGFENCVLKGKTSYSRPNWSPKGDRLLFSNGGGADIDIGVYTLENKSKAYITALRGREYDAAYANDGKVVLFSAEPSGTDQFDLYYVEEGGQPKPFLKGKFGMRYISWTPKSALQLEVERIKSQAEQ